MKGARKYGRKWEQEVLTCVHHSALDRITSSQLNHAGK